MKGFVVNLWDALTVYVRLRRILEEIRVSQSSTISSQASLISELVRLVKSRGEVNDSLAKAVQDGLRYGREPWSRVSTSSLPQSAVDGIIHVLELMFESRADVAQALSKELVAQDPLALNQGVVERLSPRQRLDVLKRFCSDPRYRHRLHLVDVLRSKTVIAQQQDANLSLDEYAASLAMQAGGATNSEAVGSPVQSGEGVSCEISCPLFTGDRFIVLQNDLLGRLLQRQGYIEPGLTQFILLNLKPDAVFFDVGAHFGYYTRLAAHILDSPRQIHAFEPTPSSFQILQRNCQDLARPVLNNAAVWAQTGKVTFTELGTTLSAFNTLLEPRLTEMHLENAIRLRHTVAAVSLDDYSAGLGVVPDFIKIDAENAESAIVKGMEGLLVNARPIVTLEVGDFEAPDVPSSRQLVETMMRFGYDGFEFYDGRIRTHEPRDRYPYDNLFFVPKPG
jgi:FkbM family methyltransferase